MCFVLDLLDIFILLKHAKHVFWYVIRRGLIIALVVAGSSPRAWLRETEGCGLLCFWIGISSVHSETSLEGDNWFFFISSFSTLWAGGPGRSVTVTDISTTISHFATRKLAQFYNVPTFWSIPKPQMTLAEREWSIYCRWPAFTCCCRWTGLGLKKNKPKTQELLMDNLFEVMNALHRCYSFLLWLCQLSVGHQRFYVHCNLGKQIFDFENVRVQRSVVSYFLFGSDFMPQLPCNHLSLSWEYNIVGGEIFMFLASISSSRHSQQPAAEVAPWDGWGWQECSRYLSPPSVPCYSSSAALGNTFKECGSVLVWEKKRDVLLDWSSHTETGSKTRWTRQ